MATIRRDKTTILGLKVQLGEIEGRVQELFDSGLLSQADRDLLNRLTATEAIDLDNAVTTADLATNISDLQSNTLAANVNSIREYVLGALQVGGPSVMVETLAVYNGGITLNNKPHSGVHGIMNYSTVQIVINGQPQQLSVTATATDPYRFLVNANGLDIEGYDVKIQYLYHHDARDLNNLIGDMILDGLLLIEPV